MADTHFQVNHDGSTAERKTTLWPSSKTDQEVIIRSIFEHDGWTLSSIRHISGSNWKLEVTCSIMNLKLNLFISSIRDESRQPDEFKMQLGNTYPTNEEDGWTSLVLGIYAIQEQNEPIEYILSGYEIGRYDFSTNPSIRGTRTSGLQKAKLLGMYTTDKSVLFRPEYVYYYITSQQNKSFIDTVEDTNASIKTTKDDFESLQKIFYGAPGTGKSNKIEEETNDTNRIRTTFHPDSDYSAFVGAYKPTMEETGELHPNGDKKSIITYSFVPQAFLKAYVNAWMIQEKEEKPHPYYLVIEEINRGNCAQIFGDLFQLLDRGPNGDSKYDITPDDDIRRHLAEQFKDCSNIPIEIKSGEKMRLPNNLYIWATMNTSDQSLFPIDSAFKRRWDWEYVPIEDGKKGFYIDIDGKKYDWWNFIETINKKIDSITGSEDKKLGYWFAKPAGDSIVITQKQFISKVLFYLWNDVYKDYSDSTQSIFRRKVNNKDEKLPFTSFFGANAVDNILAFLDYNGIIPYSEEDITDDPNDLASTNAVQKDFTRYSLNGLGNYSKGMVVFESIKAYIANNPQATAQEIRDYWVSLLPEIPHLVETNSEHTSRKSLSTDSRFDEKSKMLNLDNGETIFVSNQFNVERIGKFVQKVNSENNNIQIETILG